MKNTRILKNLSRILSFCAAVSITVCVCFVCLSNQSICSDAASALARQAFFNCSDLSFDSPKAILKSAACFGNNTLSSYSQEYKESVFPKQLQVQDKLRNDYNQPTTSGTLPLNENSDNQQSKNDSAANNGTVIGNGFYPIIETDFSADNLFSLNSTVKAKPDTHLLYNQMLPKPEHNEDEPLVLVLHTHATECYSREDSFFYDENAATRTTDNNFNMVAVGKEFCDTLEASGINTIHCTVQHDAQSYRNSYTLAAESIKSYLKDYPSIRYVFDLHRDAVLYENKAKARPIAEINNQKAAQIMILVGTDEGGADFPNWENNLSLALKLATKLDENYHGLVRPIALRGASYNEQYTDGSLLIEIGTDGNTLSEAKYSAKLLAETFAELIN